MIPAKDEFKYGLLRDEEAYTMSVDEPDAFSVIYDRYAAGFLRRASYILGDQEEARDAVQETFVRLYRAAPRFRLRPGIPFKAFAYRVLVNVCLSAIRKRAVRPFALISEEVAEMIADPSVEDAYERYVARDWLVSLLVSLPQALRRTVEAVAFSERLTEDIAKEEGVTEVAVRVRMTRAKKELRKLSFARDRA